MASVSMVSTVGYGILYMYDRDMAEEIGKRLSWNSVKAYHKLNLEMDNLKRWYNINNRERLSKSDDERDDDDKELEFKVKNTVEFVGYREKDDTTYTTFFLEDNEYLIKTKFDLMFLRKEDKYKRIFDKGAIGSETFEKIEKLFIQVELCQNDEKIAIHKKLEGFYLEDNTIMDNTFLNWYVKIFYDLILNEKYSISIIDTDINMFKMTKEQQVKIKNKQYDIQTTDI